MSSNPASLVCLCRSWIYIDDVIHPLRTCHYLLLHCLLSRQCDDDIVSKHFCCLSECYSTPANLCQNAQMNKMYNVVLMYSLFCIVMCLIRLREGVRKMEEKHFSEHNDEHVEFLPVEWRSKLTLDGGLCVFFKVCIHMYLLLLFGLCLCEQCTSSCSLW